MAPGLPRATRALGLILAVCAAAGCDRGRPAKAPEVRLGQEVLVGLNDRTQPGVAAFLGIPFAEAPVGQLRWQAPQPRHAQSGRREVTTFAAACYQDDYNVDWYRRVGAAFGADPGQFRNPPFSEDCLYLNVWTPTPDRDARLPVMVWIHGGANRSGWSFEPNYRGEHLAARGNLIVVSIAYRHGVFGFFGHPELGSAVNFGLLDQIAALRWVQAHVAAFGGEPGNVTIFGESAGAADIGYLVSSPQAAGLFRRVISQSGGYHLLERRRLADMQALGEKVSAALPGHPDLAGMRRIESARILAAANTALEDYDWGPAVDGAVIPARVSAPALPHTAPVDLLVGTNADEWYMYVDEDTAGRDAAIGDLPAAAQPALRALASSEASVRKGHDRAVTFANMLCPGYLMARAAHLGGASAYVYRFTRVRPGPGGRALGAYHGAEIPYVFDTHDAWLPTAATDQRLTETIMRYWANFARSGDPNADGLPVWPAYDAAAARVMVLGDDLAPQPAPDHALCLELAGALYGARP